MSGTPAAITGVGAVSALGVGADTLERRWLDGESGLEDGAGYCDEFDPSEVLSKKDVRRMHRCVQLAVRACTEATQTAWGDELPYPPERVGCVLGVAFGGTEVVCEQYREFEQKGTDGVWTLTVPVGMGNAAPAVLAIKFGFNGPTHNIGSACAAGAQAIGEGLRMIRTGTVDAVIVGGTEAPVTDYLQAAFLASGALSKIGISRPFDCRRDGFVLSEAAGILVLEHPDRAAERGATVLGHLAGYCSTTDAYHLTAPAQSGEMCARAIRGAIEDAGLTPEDVDYVNAHGTSTTSNDRAETKALKLALGDHAYQVPVSAPKSVLGHSIGAAGGVEAVTALLGLRDRAAQPVVGYEEPEEGLDLAYVSGAPKPLEPREPGAPLVGISNSFAFGGHNASMVLTA